MNFQNNLNNIGILLLILCIIPFNIVIGGNEQQLPIVIISVFTGLSLLILAIKKIKYKEKIIKSKIDIALSIFMVTLTLPLMFKTYCTYQGTFEFILKYFFVYTMYLLARNVVDTDKKKNVIIETTIFSSLIIIVFGFDMLYGNNLKWILKSLHLLYTPNYRFTATFGYANATSVYIAFCVFLAINRIENAKSKSIKVIYFLYTILGSYVIYISYSRVVLILYTLTLLFYFGIKVYKRIKDNKKLIEYLGLAFIVILLCFIGYLLVTINISRPYEIESSKKFRKSFEPNQEYTIAFDISVINQQGLKSNIYFQIIEINEYFHERVLKTQALSEGNNLLEFKIIPSEDVYQIKIKTVNQGNHKVIINNCYINAKEYIFSHKYIPEIISRLLTTFSIKDDSIVLRKQYYENCIRIAKDSWVIGHGGNAWKILSLAYEDYPYDVKETHSYFFELLISYGIIGVVAFLVIVILLCINIIKDKEKRKQKLSISIGLMLFLIYSITFDFSMSFILTILIVFVYIALLQNNRKIEDQEFQKNRYFKNLVDWCAMIFIGLVAIILIKADIAKYAINDAETKVQLAPYVAEYRKNYINESKKTNLEEIKKFMLKEPYLLQDDMFKLYWNAIGEKSQDLSKKELIDYIDFGIERFKTIKPKSPMYFETVLERVQAMANAVNVLESIVDEDMGSRIQDLKKLMIKEYKINSINIKNVKIYNNNILYGRGDFLERYENILQTVDIKID